MDQVKVGIIGCGTISPIYFEAGRKFEILDIVACADMDDAKARQRAQEFGIPKACSVEELLADPQIEIVVNLTIPKAHADIHLRALESGKHTYGEKPLAVKPEDGLRILALAKQKGLLVGGAPDTFLGGAIQTARKLIDDGWIGRPLGATAFMVSPGPESWHPNPGFLYEEGAGPLFDMGPYYLTALVNLLGPVRRVTGSAQITSTQRLVTNPANYGAKIQVETPTHVAGVLEFADNAIGTLITSFDVWGAELPDIEIYGTAGTLSVPHPNFYDGRVKVKRFDQAFADIPLTHGFTQNSRGLGLMDMAYAIRNGRPHRANGEMCHHVLEIMHGLLQASVNGKHYKLKSTCDKPQAFPTGLPEHALDG